MPNLDFDFDKLLQRVKDLSYKDILGTCEAEDARAASLERGRRTRAQALAHGSREYQDGIGQFLFYMRHGARPDGASEGRFQSYRIVVESLVRRGEYKPEALNIFKGEERPGSQ
ncbi:MAG: hypothetical protein ABSB61_04925 [Anaerolineales bacterium]